MASISDFVRIPKIDSCKHLSTGMRYAAFTQWAGILVPDFSESEPRAAGSARDLVLRAEFDDYTQTRLCTAHDMLLLLCHAISESVSENVKVLNGTINVDFISKCKSPSEFLDVVKSAAEKYDGEISFRPFLGIDTEKDNNLPLAEMLLESGIFSGIELYGRKYTEMPEKYLAIFNTARQMGIATRLSCVCFRDMKSRDEIFDLMQLLRPSYLMNPNTAVGRDQLDVYRNGRIPPEIIAFTKDNNIRLEFSPYPMLSNEHAREKTFVIREVSECGLPFALGTEDMLYLNKSISEFAADLCNMGVFSPEEITKIISGTP